jgi:hypothetical protein
MRYLELVKTSDIFDIARQDIGHLDIRILPETAVVVKNTDLIETGCFIYTEANKNMGMVAFYFKNIEISHYKATKSYMFLYQGLLSLEKSLNIKYIYNIPISLGGIAKKSGITLSHTNYLGYT